MKLVKFVDTLDDDYINVKGHYNERKRNDYRS